MNGDWERTFPKHEQKLNNTLRFDHKKILDLDLICTNKPDIKIRPK